MVRSQMHLHRTSNAEHGTVGRPMLATTIPLPLLLPRKADGPVYQRQEQTPAASVENEVARYSMKQGFQSASGAVEARTGQTNVDGPQGIRNQLDCPPPCPNHLESL